jgi:hypothetical protein
MAPKGAFDDMVMALAIGVSVTDDIPRAHIDDSVSPERYGISSITGY